ncbi:transglycosylase SLT domain-containing protein [Aureispira anguillae]|uniref:Transglycosylase SLT domain-containing protein n=1 Tax=Aureispira anguillae TaxID=2864201 RepID=A0A915YIW4_9BACT|nr:transglycosylase SLT domain-containing protein [Aureispira anguillae]BDS14009.1 transglycosylase SLT domain-containing protein [Aureispira anguillae]
MNFNCTALKTTWLVLLTLCCYNWTYATSPDFPEINDDLSKLLVDGMGGLMNDYPNEDPDFPTFTDEHYRARFMEMSGAIQYRLTADIKNHIIHRTERYRSATERTLGLTEMYFPIFEEYLAAKNIPHHLKYLPIVESNLNAVAKSHASAVGLWQFIPGTGKLYGLKVASYLDERSDTHKASNAAATMLANLYKRYGDWPLALAAYNCGPGRVDKYVKGNDKNFWDIRKFLPRETQMYVPYFMAVAYSYEFYHLHELKPKRLPSDLVLTDSIHLEPGYQTLSQLSKTYKIDKDTLKRLNPGYIKNYVPSSSKNSILVLPARIVAKVRGYEAGWKRIMSMKTENPIKCIRRVNTEADLNRMMRAHRFSRQDLLFWNGLPSNYRVKKGDVIAIRKYYVPKDAWAKKEVRKNIKGISIASLKVVGLDDKKKKAVTAPVYVTIKSKKLAQKIAASSVNPTHRNNNSNLKTAPTKGNPYQLSNKATALTAQKARKTEVITTVSKNRSRGRRLRNNASSNSNSYLVPTKNNPKIIEKKVEQPLVREPAVSQAALAQKKIEDAAIKKATATRQVKQLSRSIQSKEQAVIKAKAYTPTSAEEVSTLSYLTKEVAVLKKERLAKKKASELNKVKAAKALKEKQELEAKKAAEKQLANTYQYHIVTEKETIWDIEKQYQGISARSILLLNNISTSTILRKGMKLKIRVQ